MRHAAQFFKVLADEARLRMLWLLFNHRELCVCDLMAVLDITQSKASRHLSTLRHAGIVTDRKEGLWSYYAIRQAEDTLARKHLDLLKTSLATRPDAAPLLAKLRTCLAAKDRAVGCAGDSARVTVKVKTAKRLRRHSPKGNAR